MKIFIAKLIAFISLFASFSLAWADEKSAYIEKTNKYPKLLVGKWYSEENKDNEITKSYVEYRENHTSTQYIYISIQGAQPSDDIYMVCTAAWSIEMQGILKTTVESCDPAILEPGNTSLDIINELTETKFSYVPVGAEDASVTTSYRVNKMPNSFPLKKGGQTSATSDVPKSDTH